jgi:hypothetical protein
VRVNGFEVQATTSTCPRCGGVAIPIVHGLPGLELFEAADRGEVALGGCMVFDEQPEWVCRGVDCGLEFVAIRG